MVFGFVSIIWAFLFEVFKGKFYTTTHKGLLLLLKQNIVIKYFQNNIFCFICYILKYRNYVLFSLNKLDYTIKIYYFLQLYKNKTKL